MEHTSQNIFKLFHKKGKQNKFSEKWNGLSKISLLSIPDWIHFILYLFTNNSYKIHFANFAKLTSSVKIPKFFVQLTAKVISIISISAKILVISKTVPWIIRSSPFKKGNVIYNFYCLCFAHFTSHSYWYHNARNLKIHCNSYCQEWGFLKKKIPKQNTFSVCFKSSVLKSHRQNVGFRSCAFFVS